MRKLKNLTRIDAIRGKSSNVQNAINALEDSSSTSPDCDDLKNNNGFKLANLTHLTFRDPHGIPNAAPRCPNVKSVKVIYNVYEYNYDASVDKCLVHLELFPEFNKGNLVLEADLNCMNMLFVIQMRNLKLWGPSLRRLCLTESEFLHPQTLNPIALQCPNLNELVVVNPSTISDDLFVGQVPQLSEKPFQSLKHLTFEAEKFPMHVAKFLLASSVNLEEVLIILESLSIPKFSGMI